MQITEHIHALRLSFTLPLAPGRTLERFVYAYLVFGERITLVDSGVAATADVIPDYVRRTGRDPGEIDTLVLTHAHPDHVGGAPRIQNATGCRVAAHRDDVPWIEDPERQFRERPVPGFASLVEGPVGVDRVLTDGDVLDLGDAGTLRAIHVPGHAAGQIALFHEADGALFSADAVPLPGDIPLYDDARASLASIERLRRVEGVRVHLSSWDEPRRGDALPQAFDNAAGVIQRMGAAVAEARTRLATVTGAELDIPAIAAEVIEALSLPPVARNPLFFRTVAAHLAAG